RFVVGVGGFEIFCGNRCAVGVGTRVVEGGREFGFEALADVVFEPVGLVVNLGPVVVQLLRKEQFEQSMMADSFDSDEFALGGQSDAFVLLSLDETGVFETFHRRRHRWSRDAERVGDGRRSDRAVVILESIHRLNVIFGFRTWHIYALVVWILNSYCRPSKYDPSKNRGHPLMKYEII